MKKYSYGRLIRMSWKKTAEILFRPFSMKKWIMLGIIVLLAGQISGFNFNVNGNKNNLEKMFGQTSKIAPVEQIIPDDLSIQSIRSLLIPGDPKKSDIAGYEHRRRITPPGLTIIPVDVVQANFSFVFIESVVKNDASFRVPFHKNKPQGNSYLMWNIFFSSAAVLLLSVIIIPPVVTIVKSGMLTGRTAFDMAGIFSIISPYITPLLASIVALVLVAMIVVDFILPIMYRKKVSILSAWSVFQKLVSKNFGDVLLYFLVKLGLGILAILVSIAVAILGVICLLLIGGASGLLGWLIYLIVPQAAKAGVFIVLATLGTGILIILAGLFTLLFLPIPVFFRAFSIYVLGSMDESLDIFEPNTPGMAEGEDTSRYKKSMRLVWFTVLSPLIMVVLGLFAAIAITIPNIVKAKQGYIKQDAAPKKDIVPDEKLVTVYLKNGNSFKAKMERESKNNILFAIEGGTFILPRSDILRIEE